MCEQLAPGLGAHVVGLVDDHEIEARQPIDTPDCRVHRQDKHRRIVVAVEAGGDDAMPHTSLREFLGSLPDQLAAMRQHGASAAFACGTVENVPENDGLAGAGRQTEQHGAMAGGVARPQPFDVAGLVGAQDEWHEIPPPAGCSPCVLPASAPTKSNWGL